MVARKPLPQNASADNDDINSAEPPRIEVWSATTSESDPGRIWDAQDQPPSGDTQTNKMEPTNTPQQAPNPLRPDATTTTGTASPHEQGHQNPWADVGGSANVTIVDGSPARMDEVPNVLRPGVARSETNPFKRKPLSSTSGILDSAEGRPREPGMASELPTDTFSQLQVNKSPEPSTNPWQPALDGSTNSGHAQTPQSLLDQDLTNNVWESESKLKSISPGVTPPPAGNVQPLLSASSSLGNSTAVNGPLGNEKAREGETSDDKSKRTTQPQPESLLEAVDDWNLVDHEPMPEPAPDSLSNQSAWENLMDAEDDTAKEVATRETEEAPALPPRASVEVPPPQPPRQPSNNVNMSETYQIKSINWNDPNATENPRKSPILVQNANGPCPLVALVNALTLTTPAHQKGMNLATTLGSREQVSLSFLLGAVVEELISFRHTEPNTPLPDLTELYTFLQGLHTGMNVNPRFIPLSDAVSAHNPVPLSHGHPSDSDGGIPGTFESTRDMELYATFKIPLIHGWLPPRDDPIYDVLKRRASSYDEAQNLMFHEEELEHKFSTSEAGLTEEEQQLYQDIIAIKSYLSTTATQLTPSGLDVVTKAINPGRFAILFRNDHFSTLYRHPHTLQLFTLVTDAGYYTHDEVVWETLADVTGERTDFFSGDFRVIGGNQRQRAASTNDTWYDAAGTSSEGGWQTVQNRRSRNNQPRESEPNSTSRSLQHEQEDMDLALALQLQEEEEQRHRAEQAARRRESRLSEQFIEQQGRDGDRTGPRIRGGSLGSNSRGSIHSLPPPRGSSTNQPSRATTQARGGRPVQQVRSLIPPRTHRPAEDGLDDAPPSYEQAAKSTPYLPPAGHPSHPESNPRSPDPNPSPNPRRSSTLRSQANAGPSTPPRPRQPAATASAGGTAGGNTKDKDCNVM